ncbi:MAG: D-alanyl-D-alanine carboxypeptidase, partial [Candidatus Acidiferrales bacterium]
MTRRKKIIALTPLLVLIAGIVVAWASTAPAQSDSLLTARIREIASRPEYRHASFGVEVYSLDDDKVVYALNGQQLFTPASTTKLLTEGTALELLGADYRFHTRVYRTGAIAPDGTLNGDLILVASGDPNLSGRIQPDGTLAFQNEDHSYDASPDTKAVAGDPLLVIRELAAQVAAKGIKRVAGRVLVDATLFPEGGHEDGTGAVISPICVNDNIIDVTVSPGAAEGAPVGMSVSPATGYVNFVNRAVTGPAGAKPDIQPPIETANPDGTYTVTMTGTFPLGKAAILYAYDVPTPSRFAQVAFAEALREKGIAATAPPPSEKVDVGGVAAEYTTENVVAERVSAPLSEEIKVTLKVSQNLHA